MPLQEQPSYEELAAGNAELLAVGAEQAALIETLRAEIAALRRQAGRDSSNLAAAESGQPGGRGEGKGGRGGERGRPAAGGQKGHPGAGLQMVAEAGRDPDR